MRYLLILILAFVGSKVVAQKPFEGKIVYKTISLGSDQESRMVVYFGRNKIRVEHSEMNELLKSVYTILNFDSGKAYIIYPESKTFGSILLIKNKAVTVKSIKEIAGHRTTTIPPSGNNSLNTLLPAATVYIADDLYFPTNAIYLGDFLVLLLFQNGHIALGSKVDAYGDLPEEIRTSKYKQTTISFMADSVLQQTLSESLFAIPNGYKEKYHENHLEQFDGTTINQKDSIDAADTTSYPQKLPVGKSKHPSRKKNPTTKSTLHRKQE